MLIEFVYTEILFSFLCVPCDADMMKINDILSQYPMISLAMASDDQKLCQFFEKSPMSSSGLNLRYLRFPDFFTFLNYQGDKAFIFCAHNSDGELIGVASVTVREGYFHGKKIKIGYLSDLRVDRSKSNPEFSAQWKKCMGELIENFSNIDEMKTDFLITAILADNQKAKKALVNRPENEFHYECISHYKMINIFKKFKIGNKVKSYFLKPQYYVHWLDSSQKDQVDLVFDFLEQANKNKEFGFTVNFIKNAIKTWKGADYNKFLVVKKKEKIVATALVWNPSEVKKIIIDALPFSLRILNTFMKLFTNTPRIGDELKVEYLNFLHIQKGYENAIDEMIYFLSQCGHLDAFHSVAFADFEQRSFENHLHGTIKTSTKLELYQVVSKKDKEKQKLLVLDDNPGFEISLV